MGGLWWTARKVSVSSQKFPPLLAEELTHTAWSDSKISNNIVLNLQMKSFWGQRWVELSHLKALENMSMNFRGWDPPPRVFGCCASRCQAAQLMLPFCNFAVRPSNKTLWSPSVSISCFLKKCNWCEHEGGILLGNSIWSWRTLDWTRDGGFRERLESLWDKKGHGQARCSD